MKKIVCAFLLSTSIIGFSSVISNAYSVTKNGQYFPEVNVLVTYSGTPVQGYAYINRGDNRNNNSPNTSKVATTVRNTNSLLNSDSGTVWAKSIGYSSPMLTTTATATATISGNKVVIDTASK